ncbi:MAG TPA: hypothetical protein VGC21_04615 [Telluria sp.]|jgi:hypothetical protein
MLTPAARQPVRLRVWLGLLLALQALACWPLASLFSLHTLYASLALGAVGVLIASRALPLAHLPEAARTLSLYPDAGPCQEPACPATPGEHGGD